MLLKLFFVILMFWAARLALRVLLPRRPSGSNGPRQTSRPSRSEKSSDSLRDLTQQEISDADFEEIPPEKE